jgi:multisubunit Na+/H+ antiporter MnhC subunit
MAAGSMMAAPPAQLILTGSTYLFKRRRLMRIITGILIVSLAAGLPILGQESQENAPKLPDVELHQLPKIIQGPVVLGTGDRWAVISWTTNAAGRAGSIIYAGTSRSNLKPLAQKQEPVRISDLPSYQEQEYTHLVRLNDLKPGTTYYFVVDSGMGHESGRSSISRLTTQGAGYPLTP